VGVFPGGPPRRNWNVQATCLNGIFEYLSICKIFVWKQWRNKILEILRCHLCLLRSRVGRFVEHGLQRRCSAGMGASLSLFIEDDEMWLQNGPKMVSVASRLAAGSVSHRND
jgi:hypothetical protein